MGLYIFMERDGTINGPCFSMWHSFVIDNTMIQQLAVTFHPNGCIVIDHTLIDVFIYHTTVVQQAHPELSTIPCKHPLP